MKKTIVQFLKFAVVGALAFLIDDGILQLLVYFFGMDYEIIFSVFSFTVSVIFNYIFSMKFVFRGKEDMNRRTELLIFVVLSVIGLFVNTVCMWGFGFIPIESVVSGFTNSAKGTEALMVLVKKLMATFVVMIWNFISRKIFLEEKNPEPDNQPEQSE